jgi:hypothetical protein
VLGLAIALSVAGCGQVDTVDGKATINEVPPPQGSALLSWTPVTRTTDGATLTDLGGYNVYYGTSPAAMNSVVVLSDPTQTTYTVANLSAGTWYFAVAAFTSGGVNGAVSNVGSKTID